VPLKYMVHVAPIHLLLLQRTPPDPGATSRQ
jgi:hypothetical protein